MDVLGLAALALVAVEWLAIGRLSGVSWPGPGFWAARWSLSLLIGAFLVGFVQLLLSLVGVGFASVPLVLVVSAALAAAMRLLLGSGPAAGRVLGSPHASAAPTGSPLGPATPPAGAHAAGGPAIKPHAAAAPVSQRERYAWLVLAAVLSAATVRAFVVPEAGWDAYSHWGLKAQAYALAGRIVDAGTVHEYYPPLVPLLEAWLSLHRGAVSIDLVKTVWPLIGSAFAICLAWHLRLVLAKPWLAPIYAIGIVLATTQFLESFWTGQADLALTAYVTLATLAVWQWLQLPDRRWLVQAVLFAAAAGLTKYEGLPRVAVVVAAVLLEALLVRCRMHLGPALLLGVGAAVGYLPWLAFRWWHGIGATSEHISRFQPAATGSVVVAVIAALAGVRTGGGVVAVVLAWLVAGRRLLAPPMRLLTLVVLGQVLATLLAFLISETAPDVQARTSATRLVEQFLPLALFASAVYLARASASE